MPLEVRELHIKVSVNDGNTPSTKNDTNDAESNTEAIIQMCVERVLDILKRKQER